MGGMGSGRRRSESTGSSILTTGLLQLPAVDVRALKRQGLITREHAGLIVQGDQYAAGEVRLRLAWTTCLFAGERPWFVCPGEGCGRRAAILYLEERSGRLLCRICLSLSYLSQRARRRRARKKKKAS